MLVESAPEERVEAVEEEKEKEEEEEVVRTVNVCPQVASSELGLL